MWRVGLSLSLAELTGTRQKIWGSQVALRQVGEARAEILMLSLLQQQHREPLRQYSHVRPGAAAATAVVEVAGGNRFAGVVDGAMRATYQPIILEICTNLLANSFCWTFVPPNSQHL